jgi:hypothetical protein
MRVLILGQGKSGTTVLLYAIHDGLNRATGREHTVIFEPPDLKTVGRFTRDIIVKKLVGTVREHEYKIFKQFKRIVWIERDPRDMVISRFLYNFRHRPLSQNSEQLNTMLELLRKKEADPLSVGFCELIETGKQFDGVDVIASTEIDQQKAHNIWHQLKKPPVVVRYEDFISGNASNLEQVFGVPINVNVDIPPPRNRVVRTKSSGDWRNWFTPRDVEKLKLRLHCIASTPESWNSWKTNDHPRIDTAYSSHYIVDLLSRN